MGINPDNPTSVLIQPTPSGGRHYYVFFDSPYLLSQYHQLLHAVKLQHVPGEIEFYPSTKHGLRLPFGYIPGKTHDPQAWIQFIDDYRNGKIIRHSLADCHDSLEKHTEIQSRRIQSVKESRPGSPTGNMHQKVSSSSTPKSAEPTRYPNHGADADSRYRSLLEEIRCSTDAEELMSLGILLPGTRTKVLNHLAAHLIWFRHLSAADATKELTEWALNKRHNSKDIQEDLACGTDAVARHIARICGWHARHKTTSPHSRNSATTNVAKFTQAELETVRTALGKTPRSDRREQAEFYLHFLHFSKRHGTTTPDNQAWQSSPAVRQVIRRWPGCHHMNYKLRIAHALESGLLEITREKWHRPGGMGRARNYRLNVVPDQSTTAMIDYDTALNMLVTNAPLVASVKEKTSDNQNQYDFGVANATQPESDTRSNGSQGENERGDSPTLCPQGARIRLEAGPHQRHRESNAIANVLGEHHAVLRTSHVRGRRHDQQIKPEESLEAFLFTEHARFANRTGTEAITSCQQPEVAPS